MELLNRQKKKIKAFGVFLAFMLLCTLISRSVYASGLPQVSTKTPESSALSHTVEAEGVVEAGRETAVTALSGLRCDTVFVRQGDSVDTDTALFQVDLKDLQEQIETQKLAISKLSLQIQAQEQNRQLEAGQKSEQEDRAREDYDAAKDSADRAVDRAQQDLDAAEAALGAAQAEYDAWKAAQAEDKAEEQTVGEPEPQAEAEAEMPEGGASESGTDVQAEEGTGELPADETTQPGSPEQPDGTEQPGSPEQPDGTEQPEETKTEETWAQELSALEQAVETARRALEDAKAGRDSALESAERAVEDAKGQSTVDNSLEINQLELSSLQNTLKKYQELLNANGLVYPEKAGIVTAIAVSPGERIPDGAALVLADLDSPLQFSAVLTAEQKKYVNQGDSVTLKLGKTKIEAVADYIAESAAAPGSYEIMVFLEAGEGELGESGTLSASTRTDTYSSVVPLEAVYTDGNQRKYVYVMDERSGILGTEFIARKVYVNMLDQNDSQAALEEGSLGGSEEIITDSTKELEDGDVVRYKE